MIQTLTDGARLAAWGSGPGLFAAVCGLVLYYFLVWKKRSDPYDGEWYNGPLSQGVNYSPDMPRKPTPLAGGIWKNVVPPHVGLDGVTISRGPLDPTKGIAVKYRVTGAGITTVEHPDEEPILTLYIERKGDNGTLSPKYEGYRLYSAKPLPLTEGEHEAFVSYDPANWVCVDGAGAADEIEAFRTTLASKGRIGIGVGSWSGRMHGVQSPTGFEIDLIEWSVA